MNKDLILQNKTWSFSSLSTFNTCAHAFYLNYIENVGPQSGNFYASVGIFCHEILEKYFRKELEIFELGDYFREHYHEIVKSPIPYPKGLEQKYYDAICLLFDYFAFDRDKYDVLAIEDKYEIEIEGFKVVVKPDLLLKEIESGKIILIDYKTSNYSANKHKSYQKQLVLYAEIIKRTTEIQIDEIRVWYLRVDKFVDVVYTTDIAKEVMVWFQNGIRNILQEKDFEADTSQEYFCNVLCSVREYCQYKKEK